MSVLKELINADSSLSQGVSKVNAKAKVKAVGKVSIAMGSYAYLRQGDGNVKALEKAEREIFRSGDEALIAEWESLVSELNKASNDFISTYMESSNSLLQRLAKLAK